MSEWISVKERLPPPGTEALVMFSDGDVYLAREGHALNSENITHWAPLPPPPPKPISKDEALREAIDVLREFSTQVYVARTASSLVDLATKASRSADRLREALEAQ